jgi:hypothetical protein
MPRTQHNPNLEIVLINDNIPIYKKYYDDYKLLNYDNVLSKIKCFAKDKCHGKEMINSKANINYNKLINSNYVNVNKKLICKGKTDLILNNMFCKRYHLMSFHKMVAILNGKNICTKSYNGRCYNILKDGEVGNCQSCMKISKIRNKQMKLDKNDGVCKCEEQYIDEYSDLDYDVKYPDDFKLGICNAIAMKAEDKCGYLGLPQYGGFFCSHHKMQFHKLIAELNGYKVCSRSKTNHCYHFVDNPHYERCKYCRNNDKEAYKKHMEIYKKLVNNDKNLHVCIDCLQLSSFNNIIKKKENYIKRCNECNKKSNNNSAKFKINRTPERIEEDKLKSRDYETRPEIKKMRKKWKKENRYMCMLYWKMYRLRQKKYNLHAYLKRNADNQEKYRKRNPEKVIESNAKDKKSPNAVLGDYKGRCEKFEKQIWQLDDDVAKKFFYLDCFYCGIKEQQLNRLMGIDRCFNDQPYSLSNCVSACKDCNMMKKDYNWKQYIIKFIQIYIYKDDTYFLRDHYDEILNGTFKNPTYLFNSLFNDTSSVSYSDYKYRANEKNLKFELLKEEFNDIIEKECYLCGKKTTDTHINGIDRFNNKLGYVKNNCMPCCTMCNYMKKNYDYVDFLVKCYLVYQLFIDYVPLLLDNTIKTPYEFVQCVINSSENVPENFVAYYNIVQNELNNKDMNDLSKHDRTTIKSEYEFIKEILKNIKSLKDENKYDEINAYIDEYENMDKIFKSSRCALKKLNPVDYKKRRDDKKKAKLDRQTNSEILKQEMIELSPENEEKIEIYINAREKCEKLI